MWSDTDTIPELTSVAAREPNERPFTIMPVAGHLLRILDVYPLKDGGKRTVMHRTRTLDYVVVIEGELVLILDDSEVILKPGDVVVQRGTDHAWENRSGHDCARGVLPHRCAFQRGAAGQAAEATGAHELGTYFIWIEPRRSRNFHSPPSRTKRSLNSPK